MHRVHITIDKVGREFTFDFPQTVARDEVLQKVFNTNPGYKDTLDEGDARNYPDVFIRWEDLDAPKKAKIVDMGQDGIKEPTDASPSEAPADVNEGTTTGTATANAEVTSDVTGTKTDATRATAPAETPAG